MTFEEVLDQTMAMLQRRGRVTYRTLQAQVYLYRYHDILYVAVVAVVEQRHWLVMFAMDGVMESSYVVERPEHYLSHPAFECIGSLSEVMA